MTNPTLPKTLGVELILTEQDIERFWSKVDKTATCWIWTAGCIHDGYGRFWVKSIQNNTSAHRLAYELTHGPLPKDLQMDHLCRVRNCVNPEHLEPVTCAVNLLRGETLNAYYAKRIECKRGHSLPNGGSCGACRRLTTEKWNAIKREKRKTNGTRR